jgi:predicted enzyme related to lactoylglutathione lyase
MKKIAAAAVAALVLAMPAMAQETRLRSVRVSADDVAAVGKFYETTFGLRQVRTVERDKKLFEVILNYGDTAEAASASRSTRLVIILRQLDAPKPSVANLIFGVKDVDATIAKAVKAGGTLSRPVSTSATTGSRVGFIKDPAGNEIELIDE